MAYLCANDYPQLSLSNSNDQRLIDYSPEFLSRAYSLCGLWRVSSGVAFPTRSDLRVDHCENLKKSEAGLALYVDYFLIEESSGESKYFQENFLCFLATNDRDKDSIPDYAVDECGYFTDNDSDLDNDGILNWFDKSHEVKIEKEKHTAYACPDSGGAELPPIIDWSISRLEGGATKIFNSKDCNGLDQPLCAIQRELWKDYQIILYEQDDNFSLTMASAASDVIRYVFGENIKKHPIRLGCGEVNLVKAISTAKYPVREESVNNCGINNEISAEAKAATYEMILYPSNLLRPSPLTSLILLTHEIAHFYQFNKDFKNPKNFIDFVEEDVWITQEFDKELKKFGWEFEYVDESKIRRRDSTINFVNDPVLHVAESYLVYGIERAKYDEYLETKNQAIDFSPSTNFSESFSKANVEAIHNLTKASMVSEYAVYDPWEWHSEVMAAYVLKSIEDHILARFEKETTVGTIDNFSKDLYANIAHRLVNRMHRAVFTLYSDDSGPGTLFDYRHLNPELLTSFRASDQIPISDVSLDYLACRYVVENITDIYNPEYLAYAATVDDVPLEAEEIEDLQPLIGKYWDDICRQF